MNKGQLNAVIERLVEAAIRRVLPNVMNEVLLQTIANANLVTEERPRVVRRKKGPKRRPPPRMTEARQAPPRKQTPAPRRRIDLNEMLDDSVGADAYEQYEARVAPQSRRAPAPEVDDYEPEPMDEPTREPAQAPVIAQRLAALDPALQAMAEGMNLSDHDDGGEMWEEGEHDSAASAAAVVSEIRDVGAAAKAAGMDFSRMRSLIERTSAPKKVVDEDDLRAKVSFENQRLKRMREKLNGGKPVE